MNFTLFRGFRDILPHQINHLHSESIDNRFGQASYLSVSPSIARAYAMENCKKFGIMFTYNLNENIKSIFLEENKDFVITKDDRIRCLDKMIEKIDPNSNISGIKCNQLATKLFDMGFELVVIHIDEGIGDGQTMYLLKNEQILNPIKFDLVLKTYDTEFEVLGTKFDVPYDYIENISIDKINEASHMLYKKLYLKT